MPSFTQIPVQLWMLQHKEIRNHIAKIFDLPRTGITEIRDNEVLTDGYCAKDLAEVTAQKMSTYVGSEESYPRLWELTVAKARYELHPPIEIKMPVEDAELPASEAEHGKKPKRSKKSEQE